MTPTQIPYNLLKIARLFYAHPEDIKYAKKWFISHLPGHNPILDQYPWMNYKAIDWLEKYLTMTMQVFEYGSGGSTLFFAKRVEHVVSIEHDKEFYLFLHEQIKEQKIMNCSYILSEPIAFNSDHIPEYGSTSFSSAWPAHNQDSFEDYVKIIDNYPDCTFDLVTVDGRARPSCTLRALPKIKKGGSLMVDNMERPRYSEITSLLSDFERKDFVGIVPSEKRAYQTSVWIIT